MHRESVNLRNPEVYTAVWLCLWQFLTNCTSAVTRIEAAITPIVLNEVTAHDTTTSSTISSVNSISWLILRYFLYLSLEMSDDSSMINWKIFGRKRSWPNRGTIQAFSWWDWVKLWETSVKIADDPADIRTEYIPIHSQFITCWPINSVGSNCKEESTRWVSFAQIQLLPVHLLLDLTSGVFLAKFLWQRCVMRDKVGSWRF
jgi:hypothetical protein